MSCIRALCRTHEKVPMGDESSLGHCWSDLLLPVANGSADRNRAQSPAKARPCGASRADAATEAAGVRDRGEPQTKEVAGCLRNRIRAQQRVVGLGFDTKRGGSWSEFYAPPSNGSRTRLSLCLSPNGAGRPNLPQWTPAAKSRMRNEGSTPIKRRSKNGSWRRTSDPRQLKRLVV
jgi:hypothetical protein